MEDLWGRKERKMHWAPSLVFGRVSWIPPSFYSKSLAHQQNVAVAFAFTDALVGDHFSSFSLWHCKKLLLAATFTPENLTVWVTEIGAKLHKVLSKLTMLHWATFVAVIVVVCGFQAAGWIPANLVQATGRSHLNFCIVSVHHLTVSFGDWRHTHSSGLCKCLFHCLDCFSLAFPQHGSLLGFSSKVTASIKLFLSTVLSIFSLVRDIFLFLFFLYL